MNPLNEEDSWRANTYRLIARLLIEPIDTDLKLSLSKLSKSDEASALGLAWNHLSESAGRLDLKAMTDEFQTLFISPTRSELMPYACWYLTGFLMDKPLARLRADLRELGLERQAKNKEPEDHVSALCESMSLLIETNDARQSVFFDQHLAPWIGLFFKDLRTSAKACFYRDVAALGEAFIEFEAVYLNLPA